MRLNIYNTAIAILLGILLPAGTASGQGCPTIEIDCSSRTAGNNEALRCESNVEGDVSNMSLNYQWSISPQVPLKTIQGRPDGMDFDIVNNPNEQFKVTLKVQGLPNGCQDTAQFDSLFEEAANGSPPEEIEIESSPSDRRAAQLPPTNSSSIVGTCAQEVVEGTPAYFTVKISDVEQAANPIYKWTLSRGKIRKGQGTSSIEVDTTDLGGNPILAITRVEGLHTALRVSCKTMIKRIPKAYKLYEISNQSLDEESKQLLRFALRLNIGLDERAYIIAIGKRRQPVEQVKRRAESVRDYLVNQCGVAPGRIMGTSIGFGKDEALQLWVVQTGATLPPKGQE